MFSQACVKNSVQGGSAWANTPYLGRHPPTATAVDGTHPTGMHSCWFIFLIGLLGCHFDTQLFNMHDALKVSVTRSWLPTEDV